MQTRAFLPVLQYALYSTTGLQQFPISDYEYLTVGKRRLPCHFFISSLGLVYRSVMRASSTQNSFA